MAIITTRLRHISASTPIELENALDALPFKVEIKGGPILLKGRWIVFFVIPEIDGLNFKSLDL